MMTYYWVYEDDSTNRARLHKATCSRYNDGVVAPALGAQDEEPPQPGHVIHRVGVPTGAIGYHPLQGLGLWGGGLGDSFQ